MSTDNPFHSVEGFDDDEKGSPRITEGGPEQVIVSDPLFFIRGCALEAHWAGFNASLLKKYVTQKGFPCLRFKETSVDPVFDISDESNFDAGWVFATGDYSSILFYKPDVYKLLIENGYRLKAEYKEEWKSEEADYERQRIISADQAASHESEREDCTPDITPSESLVDITPSNEGEKPRVVVSRSLFAGKSGPAARDALRKAELHDCIVAYVMSHDEGYKKTDIGRWLKNDIEGNLDHSTYRRHVDSLLKAASAFDIVIE